MKRVFAVAVVLLFVVLSVVVTKSTQAQSVSTENFTSGYAKVLTNDCYLLEKPNTDSHIFLLEQSYFVKVANVYDNIFFKVEYLEFEGYVEKSKIGFVEEFPKEPYLTGITFDIYDIANVCMRSSPKTIPTDNNILCTINVSTKDLTYYGKCVGEEAMQGLGNVWYYAGYQNDDGKVFKGYIYAPLTRNLSAIASSQENLSLVNITNFTSVDSLLYLNLSTKNLLIVITTIPTLFVAILLTKNSKKVITTNTEKQD